MVIPTWWSAFPLGAKHRNQETDKGSKNPVSFTFQGREGEIVESLRKKIKSLPSPGTYRERKDLLYWPNEEVLAV